ncbi:MAG: hypothetical protein ACT4OP_02865 [Actinomycetota bacterium]
MGTILIAIAIGVAIWTASVWILRLLSNPPPDVNPDDIVEVDQDFRCTVCGAEVTMKAVNPAELLPPRHCREEMVPTSKP